MTARGASQGPGWGIRIHEPDGTSWLNCLSLGDVLVFDTEEDAHVEAEHTRRQNVALVAMNARPAGRRVTVERVEQGAWTPSEFDAAILNLARLVECHAPWNESTRRVVNQARALLSSYAPERERAPRP